MKIKPIICIVDEDISLLECWNDVLDADVEVSYFSDPVKLLESCLSNSERPLNDYACIILGRKFQGGKIDTCKEDWCYQIRRRGGKILLLNWDGPITKGDLEGRFDGKIFHRHGVTWAHLRSRLLKLSQCPTGYITSEAIANAQFNSFRKDLKDRSRNSSENLKKELRNDVSSFDYLQNERGQKCKKLLLLMASSAKGQHRDLLLNYANQNSIKGEQLLEALYNRLLLASTKGFSDNCPSKYINSSPVVAKNILREALVGEAVATPIR